MELEIKRLTPALVEDYLHFFDVTPHDDDIAGSKCYCVCWCSADHRLPAELDTQEKRRRTAREYVRSGTIQGYLAYADGEVVGWCNANAKADCLHCYSWMRFMGAVDGDDRGLKVKSVFCFVITPRWQRQGVATALLQRVCEDAKADGFDAVESYPKKEFASVARDFMGPSVMYRKAGFTVYAEKDDGELVMRKLLA